MTHSLIGLMIGTLLGAGVELKTEDGPKKVERNEIGLNGPALNLAGAFKADVQAAEKKKNAAKKKADAKPAVPAPLKRRIIVFKATWCGTCALLENEWPGLRKQKFRVGTRATDNVQLIDVDQHPDLMHKYRVGALPTIILLEGNRERTRSTYFNASQMADMLRPKARRAAASDQTARESVSPETSTVVSETSTPTYQVVAPVYYRAQSRVRGYGQTAIRRRSSR